MNKSDFEKEEETREFQYVYFIENHIGTSKVKLDLSRKQTVADNLECVKVFAPKNGRVSDFFDNEYRIDANSEKVEMIVGGFLLSIPSGTVNISSFGLTEGCAVLTAVCENGAQIELDDSVPASEDEYQYMPVGAFNHDGSFYPCR